MNWGRSTTTGMWLVSALGVASSGSPQTKKTMYQLGGVSLAQELFTVTHLGL